MRRLIYAMQSSGASWITQFLAHPGEICILDLFNERRAPCAEEFEGQSVILKATASITSGCRFRDHVRRFRPDIVIAVTRDESAIRHSLAKKSYGSDVDEKLGEFRDFLDCEQFDRLISYEQCIEWARRGEFEPRRTVAEILEHCKQESRWCLRTSYRKRKHWGQGNNRANFKY